MAKSMTIEEFEALMDQYGPELDLWPAEKRPGATEFAKTTEGERILAADKALTALLGAAADETSQSTISANDKGADLFLSRLQDIPVYHRQETQPVAPGTSFWQRLLAGPFSPLALASQAAAFLAVLGVGMLVGMGTAQDTVEYDDYDISTAWLVGQDTFEMVDDEEGS